MDKKLNWSVLSLLALVGGLLACNMGEDEAKQLEALQAEACACADKACADKVFDKFKASVDKMKDKRANEENMKRITKATTEASTCLMQKGVAPSKIMTIGK